MTLKGLPCLLHQEQLLDGYYWLSQRLTDVSGFLLRILISREDKYATEELMTFPSSAQTRARKANDYLSRVSDPLLLLCGSFKSEKSHNSYIFESNNHYLYILFKATINLNLKILKGLLIRFLLEYYRIQIFAK